MRTKILNATITTKDTQGNDLPEGSVEALFSVFDTIDQSGEVVKPSFFTDGQEVAMAAWGHNWGDLPVGKGVIHVTDKGAIFKGQFFLRTTAGREHYETVKAMGGLQEYSFGFRVLQANPGVFNGQDVVYLEKGEVFEVSPVLIGDNRATQTLAIKGAIKPKKTETTDAGWDGGKMWTNLPNEPDALRAATAWIDPDGDPAAKSSYKFIHHMVSADGTVGPANIKACQVGIGVLNGGRGGTTIPDGDRQGVYNHLAGHIKDAGLDAPELKAFDALDDQTVEYTGKTFQREIDGAVAAVESLVERTKSLADLRAKEGRAISTARRSQLSDVATQLRDAAGVIDALLKETEPTKAVDVDVAAELARFELIRAGLLL